MLPSALFDWAVHQVILMYVHFLIDTSRVALVYLCIEHVCFKPAVWLCQNEFSSLFSTTVHRVATLCHRYLHPCVLDTWGNPWFIRQSFPAWRCMSSLQLVGSRDSANKFILSSSFSHQRSFLLVRPKVEEIFFFNLACFDWALQSSSDTGNPGTLQSQVWESMDAPLIPGSWCLRPASWSWWPPWSNICVCHTPNWWSSPCPSP